MPVTTHPHMSTKTQAADTLRHPQVTKVYLGLCEECKKGEGE